MVDVYKYIPTVYRVAPALDGDKKTIVEFTTELSYSGTEFFQVEASLAPSGAFPTMFASGTADVNMECIHDSLEPVLDNDSGTVFDSGTLYQGVAVSPNRFYIGYLFSLRLDTDLVYRSPYITIDSYIDTDNLFKIYKPISVYIDLINELYIATDKKFYNNFDVFSTLSGSPLNYYGVETTVGSGQFTYFDIDLHNAYLVESYLNNDIYSTASGTRAYYITEAAVASGTVTYLYGDSYSTVSGLQGNIGCDIRTWSLNTDKFFLDVEEFTTTSAVAWVDIVDNMYGVSTSGSYFKVNGVPKYNVTFSGIDNGYRMFYDPADNFYSVSGTITYTAHIENVVGDYRENNFYLLFGYNVIHDEVIDWGPNKEVTIWMKATNLAFCSTSSTDAYYFKTREYESISIGSIIKPVAPLALGSKIYPMNDFFFYGRTYTVTISGVKDFSGNEMDPYSYTFTIEDPPN